MSRHSSIELLPDEDKRELDRQLSEGKLTLDQLVAALESRGVTVSRSALGRYRKGFEETAAKLRESRDVASAFAKELGTVPNDEMGQLLIELVHTFAFRLLSSDRAENFEAADLMRLAHAIKSLSQAKSGAAKLAIQIRERERKLLSEEMEGKLAEATDHGAISAEAAREARRILGFDGGD